MDANLSAFSKIQPVENVNWGKIQVPNNNDTTGNHQYVCLKGELIDSTIWIQKRDQYLEHRHCQITIYGDFPDLNKMINEVSRVSSPWENFYGKIWTNHFFTLHVKDEKSEKFLDCINLIDKQCPLGKAALSTIWKCVAGYSTEDNARVDFLPLFVFFMGITAMKNDSPFPNEITILICQSFVQSTRLEFAKDSTDQFRKDFIANAFQPKLDVKSIAPSPSITSYDCLTLQTSDID